MNRSIKAALGGMAALALTTTGLSTAAATEPKPGEEKYPHSYTERFKETYYFPAGSVCKAKIKIFENSKVRTTRYSDTRGRAEFADWSYIKATNTKNGRTVKVGIGGDGYDKLNPKTGIVTVRGEGENVFFGPGIKGLVYTNGPIKFTVNLTNGETDILKLKGKYVELCTKLGTKPVAGKQIELPGQPPVA